MTQLFEIGKKNVNSKPSRFKV